MQLDEGVPCDNFGGKFDKIKNMKPKCTANKGPVQKKYRCNLQCTNGNTNVWSVRPIKVCYRPVLPHREDPLKNQTVIMCNFSAKSRTPILTRIQNTIHLSQPNTNGNQTKSRYRTMTQKSGMYNSYLRVPTHFVTIKKNVTMSEASTT